MHHPDVFRRGNERAYLQLFEQSNQNVTCRHSRHCERSEAIQNLTA